MQNLNLYQENYSKFPRTYQLKMDLGDENLIPENDSVRLLNNICDNLDYTKLMSTYSKRGRQQTTNPVTLFKIIVYGNTDGKYSSRDLETACKRDINYKWLLNGEAAPNHNEIARFRSGRLVYVMEDLFSQLTLELEKLGEIKFKHLFIDGTKIEANANRYTFVWKKSTGKYSLRLEKNIEKLIEAVNIKYCKFYTKETELNEILQFLTSKKKAGFVYGRGKKKSELRCEIETLNGYIAKREKYTKYNQTFCGRNSFSKTDNDATFMRVKDDHMRNGQLKPGYNVTLGVEGEYIAGVNVSAERSDQLTMKPLLERMHQNYDKRHETVTMDAGFESEENYTYFEDKPDCIAYIKPQNYERSKTKEYKNNMSLRENMPYDKDNDEYTCQNGKKLKAVYVGKRKSDNGFESEVTYYECESCECCQFKKQCTKAKCNKKLQVSKKFILQREQSLNNITSELGIQLRINRSIQAEGAFGVLKQDYGFRQFLLRGNKKVFTEMLLRAFGYNINKLHNKIQQKRTGSQLFEKLSA